MLNVSINTNPDSIQVTWEWIKARDAENKPSGYLIKWNDQEKQVDQISLDYTRLYMIQVGPEVSNFDIPLEDETAVLIILQTLGENIEEHEALVKLRCDHLGYFTKKYKGD